MKTEICQQKKIQALLAPVFCVSVCLVAFSSAVYAEPIPPNVQAKVEMYKQKLVEWAADPVIVAAIKEANVKGPGGMNNGAWNDLDDGDAKVKAMQTNAAGKALHKWEGDKGINKLFVRDEKGNLVAGTSKALLFNNGTRPQFTLPFKGKPWSANEMKPDPTTQVMSVQIAVPILDGGKPIGVMNSSVNSK